MALFRIVFRRPGEPSQSAEVRKSPWIIGRARDADLSLEGPGIWDRHVVLETVKGEGLVASVQTGALARIGGETFERRRLRSGDEITIGDTVLRVGLAEVRRRSLSIWGWFFWTILGLVFAVQVVVLQRLLE